MHLTIFCHFNRFKERAEADKKRHLREWREYIKTAEYTNNIAELEKNRKDKKKAQRRKGQRGAKRAIPVAPNSNVPIFSDEFLALDAARERELNRLRKCVAKVEEENDGLARHVGDMERAIPKLRADAAEQTGFN